MDTTQFYGGGFVTDPEGPSTVDAPWPVALLSNKLKGYIDRLGVRCGALTDAAHVADDSAFVGALGGNGGAPFTRIECPAQLAATGFAVRAGAYVDQIKLICGQ
jgi:hypothetical protein